MNYVVFLILRSLLILPAQHPFMFKAQLAASRLNLRVINNMVHLDQKKKYPVCNISITGDARNIIILLVNLATRLEEKYENTFLSLRQFSPDL